MEAKLNHQQIEQLATHPLRSPELHLFTGLHLPWAARRNPEADRHARMSQAAAFELGVLQSGVLSDQRRFEAFVAADGWAYPTASAERLHAAGGFNQWLYLLDDQYDDDPTVGRNPDAVRRIMQQTFAVLQSGVLPPRPVPFDHWTRAIRSRLAHFAPDGWVARFFADTHDYLFKGSLVVMEQWSADHVLGVDDYAELRLFDSSLHAVFDVLELAVDAVFPAEVISHPAYLELRRCAARHVAFANDLFSYHKECIRHGSRFNLLHVLQVDRQLSLGEALAEAFTMLETDLDRFVAIEASLPRFSPTVDAALLRYADGLKGWITGNVAFSKASARFRAPDAVFAELRLPV